MRILVIGGSLIGDGGIIDAVRRQYRQRSGEALGVDAILVAQSTLCDHWERFGSKSLVGFRSYDALVLQEKGTRPVEDRAESELYLYRWKALAQSKGARTFLLHPWRRKEHFDDPARVAEIDQAYYAVAKAADVSLIPVAEAWRRWEAQPGEPLYQEFGNHATPQGAELTASVILDCLLGSLALAVRS